MMPWPLSREAQGCQCFFQGAQVQTREQINHSMTKEMGYCAGLLHCSWTLGNSLTLAWFRYRNRLLVSSRSWECTCSTEPAQGEAMPWTVPGPVRHHHWPPAQKRSSRTLPRNSCLKGKERGERSCETPYRWGHGLTQKQKWPAKSQIKTGGTQREDKPAAIYPC